MKKKNPKNDLEFTQNVFEELNKNIEKAKEGKNPKFKNLGSSKTKKK